MAYWWVNQGQTFKQEYAGGFLWAPVENKDAQSFFHWENVGRIESGDIIFSYVDGHIRAVATALNNSYLCPKPGDFGALWQGEGRQVDVKYFENIASVPIQKVAELTRSMWPERYAPIQAAGRANQGYLYEVPLPIGHILMDILRVPAVVSHSAPENIENTNPTTKEAIIKARVGQGKFRKMLINQWDGQCAVTHFSTTSLLVASHIKPWALSDDRERLDPYNGLLLSPNYNALFDRFLISFSPKGSLVKSDLIEWDDLRRLEIKEGTFIRNLTDKHIQYLNYHVGLMKEKRL